MTESSFTTIYSNNLDQVTMIAGDEQLFHYSIYNSDGAPISVTGAFCTVFIFKYGDPETVVAELSGSIIGGNQFSVTFSGSGLSGVYQQQVKITDSHGGIHVPSQGKIIIFPSPTTLVNPIT
jgi:hypothetical protein